MHLHLDSTTLCFEVLRALVFLPPLLPMLPMLLLMLMPSSFADLMFFMPLLLCLLPSTLLLLLLRVLSLPTPSTMHHTIHNRCRCRQIWDFIQMFTIIVVRRIIHAPSLSWRKSLARFDVRFSFLDQR
jgi:hypothetical protein